ncbi:MAG: ABC transporter permease [Dehalococcoidales bacterium]|jgi:NitT/TauT family transport system permease protein|nr:ABC transporter permease [Dehalococcoidales bacterium]MDD5402024.1 ABC transporter permease [Dehalococcoidales bacterium]
MVKIKSILTRLKPGWGLIPILAFLLLWEVSARLNWVPGQIHFPAFSEVVKEFINLASSGALGDNFAASLFRVIVGLTAGSIAGIMMGIIMGWNELAHKTLNPIISLFLPIPPLGWLPLLMLWVGINNWLPITIIFISSFFPVLYNTVAGIKSVDKDYVKVSRTLGASDFKILTTVVMPLALPIIFTGLRLNAGHAWRVVIAAEMVAIPTGIGALMLRAESLIRIDIIIVCLIVLAIMTFLFDKLFGFFENRVTARWY